MFWYDGLGWVCKLVSRVEPSEEKVARIQYISLLSLN